MTDSNDSRERAVFQTDRSFLVEASAGTGKTTVLIQRILRCVLECGPQGRPVPLSRVCAITFTEKAAGEMKVRLLREFERHAAEGGDIGIRAQRALADLEAASISTIHAFAVSLLKERPIEAGLDPRFTALDEIQGELLFREVWETWLQQAIGNRSAPLEAALRAGLSLDALRAAAHTLRLHAHEVRRLRLPAPPTDAEARQTLVEMLQEGRSLRNLVLNPGDKLVAYLEGALAWLSDPGGSTLPRKAGSNGAAGNWEGGKETVQTVREYAKNVVELRSWYAALPVKRILDALLRLIIGEFLAAWEERKRASGRVDFDDMLWLARDLLQTSPSAHVDLRNKFDVLLVDEFQDTDPVQWEMIGLLAGGGNPESVPGGGSVAPGRLFVVGDPKQSIYRFRGADVETYLDVASGPGASRLGLETLALTRNFRSVPSILTFVDEAFHDVMKTEAGKPYQQSYLPFGGKGARAGHHAESCVVLLGDREEDGRPAGSGEKFAEIEASRIAQLVLAVNNNPAWSVESTHTRGEGWRAPHLRDIAVLLPVLTRVDALEDDFRGLGIPYVLEGGKFYYARSEVSSAITVLRSIANPNNAVAFYGALRSIFFGLSDEDLLRARLNGLPLDYRSPAPPDSELRRPYEILHELHAHRHMRSAAETLEILLQRTGAREVLAARGMQSLANLNKLVRTLRSLEGDATFPEVIETVAGLVEDEIGESESRIMEEQSDAVRIMSIHRAKGLDFPIVIVAGLGYQRRARHAEFLADAHGSGVFGLNLGSKESCLQTIGWEDLAEDEAAKEDAELVRLLYVAMTRARDHMVLSTHVKGKWDPGRERWSANYARTRLEPLAPFLEDLHAREEPLVRFLDGRDLPPGEPVKPVASEPPPEGMIAALRRQYDELRRLVRETPGGLTVRAASAAEEQQAEEERDFARDRAASIGVAFHEAMEGADLVAGFDAGRAARAAGSRHGLDGAAVAAVADMLGRASRSPVLERLRSASRAGGRVLRELPYVRPLPSGTSDIEAGKIDLLFEEHDGWVLVDYKTDRLPEDERVAAELFRAKYAAQMNSYSAALRTLGLRLKSACLLLARSGEVVDIAISI